MRSTSSPPPRQDGNVVKKLKPGAPGTLRWLERFGEKLMCVRYRIDEKSSRRYTTVELLVDDRAIPTRNAKPDQQVFLKVGVSEKTTQQQIKAAGGTWNPETRLWMLPYRKAKALKLQPRIVKNVD